MNDLELPQMPPRYSVAQSLTDDEVIDILLHAFPASWSAEMQKQGFDAFAHSPTRVLEFCEQLEASEAVFTPVKSKKDSSSKKKSGGHKKSDGEYYCLHHGKNNTHDTNDCNTLKSHSKKLKSGNESSGKSQNKTWSRKAEQSKDKTRKDLAALMKQMVREELNAVDKKRKDAGSDNDDDDDEVASLNQIDEVDLAAFNYSDMGKLKIDSDESDNDDDGLVTEVET
jgi:hypothetical protein